MLKNATPKVTDPSTIKSHRQPARPCAPSSVLNVAAAISPAKATATMFPAYSIETRVAISLRV
jgi:hypothetical protein